MSKVAEYRKILHQKKDWKPFLLKESGLPGPRGNLELAEAVALEADLGRVHELLSIPAEEAPENTPQVFLVFCGVTGLGKLIAAGDHSHIVALRGFASDGRWRIREAVAIALQYIGDQDMPFLLREMRGWARGSWYEKRAAAAALAEPRLLQDKGASRAALVILDRITDSMARSQERKTDAFKTLRQSMGYCWSVAVAADPKQGKPRFESWLPKRDPDIRWMLRENLGKSRLVRMDRRWVERCLAHLVE